MGNFRRHKQSGGAQQRMSANQTPAGTVAACVLIHGPSAGDGPPTLVIAGSAEAPEGPGSYKERCVRRGDLQSGRIREKARFVLGEMERRLGAFTARWGDTTATQVYTVHDLYPFLADEIVRRGAAEAGLTWCYCRPPVVDLEFEMDCRATNTERVV